MPKRKAEKVTGTDESTLLDEVQQHQLDSSSFLETRRDEWDDLEAMLIVKLKDDLSQTTKSKVFDPRLSTMVYERAARVMAQNPQGKAYAQSKDDVGKNILMNLLLNYYEKNANEQAPLLTKMRLWDLYSLVYGSMFALVPWRVNDKRNYVGPELLTLPIRDSFPQPHVRSIDDADWFAVRTMTSIEWLKQQDKDTWFGIDGLISEMKSDKTSDKESDDKSFVEETYYPGSINEEVFPRVELFTEYRADQWITWTPQRVNSKTSRPHILRTVKDPYPNGMLPVVAKHCFPLIDSPIGLGEFARGKSLQLAVNSLWNLYLDGVKYSIFPPLHINSDNVVPSSIKWGAGEYWFMDNPNQDVQPMRMDTTGINTFHSTFGALVSAIETQAGTTSITESADSKSGLGKTPEAIKFIAQRENSRDEWDRVMMEESIKGVYERWIALTTEKMEEDVEMRLFGDEIEDLKKWYPDVVEMFDSGKRGAVTVNKDNLDDAYDFELEVGSTYKPNIEEEQNNITAVLKAVLENPAILDAVRAKNKDIDIAELFKRWVIAGGIRDYDRIIVDNEPTKNDAMPDEQMMDGMPQGVPQDIPQGIPQDIPQGAPIAVEEFRDPDIAAAAQELLGGMGGIPPSNV